MHSRQKSRMSPAIQQPPAMASDLWRKRPFHSRPSPSSTSPRESPRDRNSTWGITELLSSALVRFLRKSVNKHLNSSCFPKLYLRPSAMWWYWDTVPCVGLKENRMYTRYTISTGLVYKTNEINSQIRHNKAPLSHCTLHENICICLTSRNLTSFLLGHN